MYRMDSSARRVFTFEDKDRFPGPKENSGPTTNQKDSLLYTLACEDARHLNMLHTTGGKGRLVILGIGQLSTREPEAPSG